MKYQVYIKKEIKSKADMPKENGRYVTHLKQTDSIRDYPFYGTKVSIKLWEMAIDWYLQPIELDLLDDEVICKLAKDRYRESSNSSDKINSYCDGMELLRDNIKNQLKQQL